MGSLGFDFAHNLNFWAFLGSEDFYLGSYVKTKNHFNERAKLEESLPIPLYPLLNPNRRNTKSFPA